MLTRPAGSGTIRHDDPTDVPTFENLDLPGLEGVNYARGQTFGVEIELGSRAYCHEFGHPEWARTANQIISCLRSSAKLPVYDKPLNYHQNDDATTWRVCFDRSCGWEIVSPILVNEGGFAELARVAQAVTNLVRQSSDLCIDPSTGLHVTLATRLDTPERRSGFAGRLTRLEPGLFTLVAPSRLYELDYDREYNNRRRNGYCPPLRELKHLPGEAVGSEWSDTSRYQSVNLLRMNDPVQLLEIRMHQGTTDYRKIILWISLWMQIFNRSRYDWCGKPEFGRVFPRGNSRVSFSQVDNEDIFRLLKREGILLPASFERLLWERRRELRQAWAYAVPNRVDCWDAAGWYDRDRAPTFAVTENK